LAHQAFGGLDVRLPVDLEWLTCFDEPVALGDEEFIWDVA
jgi:hypothetical protein